VLSDSLRTDRHCFRRLAAEDAVVIELREWSRMTEDLQQERNRLANRVREQLWRYYPQALAIGDDLAADWFLELWAVVPTPAKAARIREGTVERILKAHRIRRITAPGVLRTLRQPALTVAPGTAGAASAHIRTVAERLKLVNRQIRKAHHRLDALTATLAADNGEKPSGQVSEQRDVTILRSLPGVGRIVLATLLAEAPEPLRRRDYHALRTLSGVAPVTKRSGRRCVVIMGLYGAIDDPVMIDASGGQTASEMVTLSLSILRRRRLPWRPVHPAKTALPRPRLLRRSCRRL